MRYMVVVERGEKSWGRMFRISPVASLLVKQEVIQLVREAIALRRGEPALRHVTCSMEGTDDLAAVLGITTYFDEFAIRVSGQIVDITWRTETEPVGVIGDFQDWLRDTQPELFASGGACFGFFKGVGLPTALACTQAWLDAAPAYVAATASG